MASIAGIGSNGVMVNARSTVLERPARSALPVAPGRPYGGVSPDERVSERRARLVEAGIELFGTRGLRATTVRSVCAAAGLTDRYFYESFATLEALLQAVYQALMDGLRARMPAPTATRGRADAAEVERRFTVGYELWFEAVREPRFARIVLAEVLGVNAEVDALYEAGMRDFSERTAASLAGLKLSAERRVLVGHALVGAATQVARVWAGSGYRASRRSVVRTCVLVAMSTLRALEAEQHAAPLTP